MSSRAAQLRKLFAGSDPVILPGVGDVLSARIVQSLGFDCVFISGYAVSARLFGLPDIGVTTLSENVVLSGNIADRVRIPVIADGENGYGSTTNVTRLVRNLMKNHVAGMYINDKLEEICPHIGLNVQVLSEEEMGAKISSVNKARETEDFVLICSSSATRTKPDNNGLTITDQTIARIRLYAEMGADAVFFPWKTLADFKKFSEVARDTGKALAAVMSPFKPTIDISTAKELGYKFLIYPLDAIYAATKAELNVLSELKKSGSISRVKESLVSQEEFLKIIDAEEYKPLT